MRWIIDGNNVMGSRPDGWWNDRPKAQRRLAQRIARWCRTHADPVELIYDGVRDESVTVLGGGNLTVGFATRLGRDAADDRVVELVEEHFVDPELTVVTSDLGLIERLPPGVSVQGSSAFRKVLDGF